MAKANLHPERSRTPRRWRCLGKGRHEAADRPGKVRPDHPMRGPASASVQLIKLHSRPPLRDAVPTYVRITSGSLPFDRNCPNRLQPPAGSSPVHFRKLAVLPVNARSWEWRSRTRTCARTIVIRKGILLLSLRNRYEGFPSIIL